MPLDPEILRTLNQTGWWAALMAVTEAGDAIYGNAVPFRMRLDPSNRLIDTTPQGEEIISNQAIITTTPIGVKDHVWLPGSDPSQDAQARMPKQVDVLYDEDGSVSQYEVYL